jgi:hypothetical protein
MNEQAKLDEAQFFLARLRETSADDSLPMRCYLSAFLSAARSVLQYACEEAKTKPCGQGWYQGAVGARQVVGFFKEKRDVNIHQQRPAVPHRRTVIESTTTVRIAAPVTILIKDEAGHLLRHHRVNPSQLRSTKQPNPARVTTILVFEGWNGPEDLLTLAAAYVKELEAIVADGQKQGVLTK